MKKALEILKEEKNNLRYVLNLFDDIESPENDLKIAEGYKRIEILNKAIEELEALNDRSCESCKHLEERNKLLKHCCLQEVCRTCSRNNNDNWESKC